MGFGASKHKKNQKASKGNSSSPNSGATKTQADTASGGATQASPRSDSPSNTKNGPASSSGGSAPSSSKDSKDDDPEGWNDPMLLSKTGQQVGVDDFELLTVIGKGSFGKVMQVRKKDDGKIYAMKVLRKDAIIARKQVAHTRSEKAILQKINHPFIVNLHFAFQTDKKLYMILDYVNGGELFFHLKKEGKFPEQRVRMYAAEIVLALAHLHSFGIVYRDLKPENILLDSEGHICITDFGLSKEIQAEEGTATFCGTPEYLAPEVLSGKGHGTPVDWWSLGTLIFEMLTGLPPFYSQNINIMYNKILRGELRFPPSISPDAQSLLEGLLTRDPKLRLGSNSFKDGAADIKAHPWFTSIDWIKLEARELEAPFKPAVKGPSDFSQIDPVFTAETPVDTYVESSVLTSAGDADMFDQFTYVNESALATGAS